MYITYFNKNTPRVPKVPQVSYNTVWITVRVQVYPWWVTVRAGSGRVWENPTRGIPVFNPNYTDSTYIADADMLPKIQYATWVSSLLKSYLFISGFSFIYFI